MHVAIAECFHRVSSDITPLNFQPIPVISVPDSYMILPVPVEVQLFRIKECKSTSPDEIPNWILKSCASTSICSIFNISIKNGNAPKLWKCADDLPLCKVAQQKTIKNYLRPISLSAVVSKILESFVFSWLAEIVMPNIDPFQFGCVKRSSTKHALVHLVHSWLVDLETPNTLIRTCLIDFSNAVDRVNHVPHSLAETFDARGSSNTIKLVFEIAQGQTATY